MIKLDKLPIPNRLATNTVKWTEDVIAKTSKGERLSPSDLRRFRHPEVKEVLIKETHGKCAYCESKLLHVHHGDVEHIFPKSLEPAKIYDWNNLTLACEICNQNKSDRDPYLHNLIDPYTHEPERHIRFPGPIPVKISPKGQSTADILQLDRPHLYEMRLEALREIEGIFYRLNDDRIALVSRRSIYRELRNRYASGVGAYSAMARAVIADLTLSLDTEVTSELEE